MSSNFAHIPKESMDPKDLIQKEELISLPDTLSGLRTQLEIAHLRQIEALAEAQAVGGTPIVFTIDEVTINFEVVITKSASGSGKISYWVASAEAEGKLDRSSRHSIEIKLKIGKTPDGGVLTFGNGGSTKCGS